MMEPPQKSFHGPRITVKQKYSKLSLVTSASLEHMGVEQEISNILAGMANFGLASNTWKSYTVIINHLAKCEKDTRHNMDLPFDTAKMLTLVGWMVQRGLKSRSMSSYISALRMYHIALGYNEPVLREPMVKLILKGK